MSGSQKHHFPSFQESNGNPCNKQEMKMQALMQENNHDFDLAELPYDQHFTE